MVVNGFSFVCQGEGRSKLNPVKDGFRFLGIILQTVFLYRPSRPLGLIGLFFLFVAVILMVFPVTNYIKEGHVADWMIYRMIVSELLGGAAFLLMCCGYLGNKAVRIGLSEDPGTEKYHGSVNILFRSRWFWLIPLGLVAIAGALVWNAMRELGTTGHVREHWSRFIAMSFLLWIAVIFCVTKATDYSLNLMADRLAYLRQDSAHWKRPEPAQNDTEPTPP